MDNYFIRLNSVNVNGRTELKGKLTYLSWAWAWAEVKKLFPMAYYTIYENADGWCYHTDGKTCWVKTGVTVEGIEHIEYLPVMDYNNHSIPADKVTSFDVNKAIQRSLTKACARHGLGLYIYAGEDLPEAEAETRTDRGTVPTCLECKKPITGYTAQNGTQVSGREWTMQSVKMFGAALCVECAKKRREEQGK